MPHFDQGNHDYIPEIQFGNTEGDLSKEWVPSVFYYKSKVVIRRKFDSCLDIVWRTSIYSNYGDTPLSARESECGVQVASTNGIIWEYECLEVGRLHGPCSVCTPIAIDPICCNFRTIA